MDKEAKSCTVLAQQMAALKNAYSLSRYFFWMVRCNFFYEPKVECV